MPRHGDPATLVLLDRLSLSASVARSVPGEEDAAVATPGVDFAVLESSRVASSRPPGLRWDDRRWAGLVVHNMVVGCVSTVLPLTVFPYLTNYLNMEGTQTLSARALLAVPWAFRPVIQLTITCSTTPRVVRARAVLAFGWLACAAALAGAAWSPMPRPYFTDRKIVGVPIAARSQHDVQSINADAPRHGARAVLFMAVASFAYVTADVAADILVEETSRHERQGGEDTTAATALAGVRYPVMLISFLFMGIGMSGRDYGGDFAFSLEFSDVMAITAVLSLAPLPFACSGTSPTPTTAGQSVGAGMGKLWGLFRSRATCYVLGCRFVGGVVGGISSTAVHPIAFYWAHVQPLNDSVVSFVATSAALLFLRLAHRRGWALDLRRTIVRANVLVLVLDCGATMFTIWGLVRSQWFWIGLPVLEALPSGLDYVFLNVLSSAVAEPGPEEELLRAVLTAVAFLANAVGLAVTKYIDAHLDVTNDDLLSDTTHVRAHATATFVLAYGCQFVALGGLLVLPRHPHEAREWKLRRGGGSSPRWGAVLLLAMVAGLSWSVVVHCLSVHAATSCHWVAGGRGC